MAVLPVYRMNFYVKAARWAKFPEDFHVAAETLIDDDLISHSDVGGARWYLKPASKKSLSSRVWRHIYIDKRSHPTYLHRVIWAIKRGEIPDGLTIDHKNLDALDNQLNNLRLATQSQQIANTANRRDSTMPFKGVCFFKRIATQPKPYHAAISPKRYPSCCLGYYESPEIAAFAYNCAAHLFYGEFARLNLLPDGMVSKARQDEISSKVKEVLVKRGLIKSLAS